MGLLELLTNNGFSCCDFATEVRIDHAKLIKKQKKYKRISSVSDAGITHAKWQSFNLQCEQLYLKEL